MENTNHSDFFLFLNINSTDHYDNKSLYHNNQLLFNYENLPLVERLTIYITFVLSAVGIIGNACTIIVLNQQTMRKWRSSILLSALAAADLLYLLIIFLSIIDTLTHQAIGFHRSLLLCLTTVYITHVCSFLSATFTLSFTLQRFVAVLFPLHANTIISHRFFVTNISHGQCREDENYPALFPLLIVDICLTFILPFIFILLFNCAIVYKLQERKKFTNKFGRTAARTSSHKHSTDYNYERQRSYQPNGYANTNDNIQLKNQKKITTSKISTSCLESTKSGNEYLTCLNHPRLSTSTLSLEHMIPTTNVPNYQQTISQRTTKMLVICSTTFLIFNSPYSAILFYSFISKHVLTRTLDTLRYFYFMSFCLNFFLYSLCGNRFRQELIILLKTSLKRCWTPKFCQQWLKFDKISHQSSISRPTTRSGL